MKTECSKHNRYHGVRPPKNGCHECVMVYMNRQGLYELIQTGTRMSNILYNYNQFGDQPLREADKMVMRTWQKKWDVACENFNNNTNK